MVFVSFCILPLQGYSSFSMGLAAQTCASPFPECGHSSIIEGRELYCSLIFIAVMKWRGNHQALWFGGSRPETSSASSRERGGCGCEPCIAIWDQHGQGTRSSNEKDRERQAFSDAPCHQSNSGWQVGLTMESLGWIWVTVLRPAVTNAVAKVTACTGERPPGGILHF